MPRKGSHPAYKPKREYQYTVKDIAELAGMTRSAVSIAKVRGKVDPEDFKSVVSFLIRRIIDRRLRGDIFASARRAAKRGGRTRSQVSGKRPKKAVCRR